MIVLVPFAICNAVYGQVTRNSSKPIFHN